MIKIEFTCYVCGEKSEIGVDDIDEKTIVPICDDCYKKFLSRKGKLIKSFIKRLKKVYSDYGIPVDTFNAGEDIVVESDIE